VYWWYVIALSLLTGHLLERRVQLPAPTSSQLRAYNNTLRLWTFRSAENLFVILGLKKFVTISVNITRVWSLIYYWLSVFVSSTVTATRRLYIFLNYLMWQINLFLKLFYLIVITFCMVSYQKSVHNLRSCVHNLTLTSRPKSSF